MILIAEDDKQVQKAYARMLRGHELRIFDDAAEALLAIEGGFRPDVIISDLDMPRMQGSDFCSFVRALGLSTPFMLVSGNDDLAALAKECGANAWITKSDGDLVSKIANFVTRFVTVATVRAKS
jgi:CheY-like chemotaxis protein